MWTWWNVPGLLLYAAGLAVVIRRAGASWLAVLAAMSTMTIDGLLLPIGAVVTAGVVLATPREVLATWGTTSRRGAAPMPRAGVARTGRRVPPEDGPSTGSGPPRSLGR